jgi:hypothetical protein
MLAAMFVIDLLGRRKSLYIGMSTQMVAALYIAIFLLIVPPRTESSDIVPSAKSAGTGAVAMIYISGIGWVMGMNSFQYIVGPEIFPLRLRSLASSLIMAVEFVPSQHVPSTILTV